MRRTTSRQGPRAPMHLVERMQVAVIGLVNAYFDRLMRDIAPALRARFDAEPFPIGHVGGQVSLGEQFLQTTFRMVDRQAAEDLSRVIPVPSGTVLKNATHLEDRFIKNNTELIKLDERAREEVRKVIEGPLREGIRVEEVRKLIEERLGVVRSRAILIARDQTTKLYGQIQEARQTEAGVVEYTWSTSEDERVRGTPGGKWPKGNHFQLDGTTQRWDSPPLVDQASGRHAHPGGDIQCRCAAIPILPLDGLDEPDNPTPPGDITPTEPDNDIEAPPANDFEPAPANDLGSDLDAELHASAERAALERAQAEQAALEAELRRLELAETAPPRVEPPSGGPPSSGPPSSGPPSSQPPSGKPKGPLTELGEEKGFSVVTKGKVTADHEQAVSAALERLRVGQGNTVPLPHVEVTTRVGQSEAAGRVQLPRGTGGVYLDSDWLRSQGRDASPVLRVGVSAAHVSDFIGLGVTGGRDPWQFRPTVPHVLPNGVDVGRYDVPQNTQQLARTVAEVIEWTTTHEYGHHLHLAATSPEVDEAIEAAFRDRGRQPVSLYALDNPREFFAEAFTAYHHYPREWLEKNTPKSLRLVERVLELSGLK